MYRWPAYPPLCNRKPSRLPGSYGGGKFLVLAQGGAWSATDAPPSASTRCVGEKLSVVFIIGRTARKMSRFRHASTAISGFRSA
jgi:hypothetical protein